MSDELFLGIPPSASVQEYLKTYPQANWEDDLDFLLSNYPQKTDGQLQYLIEGGAAISLLRPESGRKPQDIDVITGSKQIERDFHNSKRFDVKNLWYWFQTRLITFSTEKAFTLLKDSAELSFRNHTVHVLNPLALAATKSQHLPFALRGQRYKDIQDVAILGFPDQELEAFAALLKH